MDSFNKLQRSQDSLRKSAKFTAAQNKEHKEDFVDCIGSMVAYCEKNGGQIPKYEITTDLDVVDKVIKDMKNYTKSLITQDTALARQIEDYLKNRENADQAKRDRKEAKEKGLDAVQLSDQDLAEHQKMLYEQSLQDEKTVYQEKYNYVTIKELKES